MAEVSSSISSADAPASAASIREAACEVEPEAFAVVKERVSVPEGSPLMNGEMSTPVTARPSSARIAAASARVITHSRPSPARCGWMPRSRARSSVDLPWKPPPTMTVTPSGMPIPLTRRPLGRSISTRSEAGLSKGIAPSRSGRSESPARRGRIAPSPTSATSPRPASRSRSASWSRWRATWARSASASWRAWNRTASAIRGRSSVSRRAARRPWMRRPEAGSSAARRASIPSSVKAMVVRSSTSWPGAPTSTRSPVCEAASASARARKSEVATRPRRSASRSSGKPAAARSTTRRMSEGGAKGSACTWSITSRHDPRS